MQFELFIKKNWLAKNFGFSKQPYYSVRTSFGCCSICLREVRAYSFGFLEAAPAKEVEEAGEKTPIFPAGKVAIWIAQQDKFMAALRWFLPREDSRIEILFA